MRPMQNFTAPRDMTSLFKIAFFMRHFMLYKSVKKRERERERLAFRIMIVYPGSYSLTQSVLDTSSEWNVMCEVTTCCFSFQLNKWPRSILAKFQFSLYPITFSVGNADEWKKLFKPCAAQRLFLPVRLPHLSLFISSPCIMPLSIVKKKKTLIHFIST